MFLNKNIIITGASSGLGASLAAEISQYKPNLILFSRNIEKLNHTAQLCIEKGANAFTFQGDVTRPEDCRRLAEESVRNLGSVDYLVLNAGVSMWSEFEEVKDQSIFLKLIETNYLGAVYIINSFLPYLVKNRGLITAVSSIQGKIPVPFHSGYVASKHALTGFLNTLRMELKPHGVDVLLVMPHWLRGTNLRKNAFDKNGNKIGESGRGHSKESVSLEECSRKIIKGMLNRKREVIIPGKLRVLTWLNLLFPSLAENIITGKVKDQE